MGTEEIATPGLYGIRRCNLRPKELWTREMFPVSFSVALVNRMWDTGLDLNIVSTDGSLGCGVSSIDIGKVYGCTKDGLPDTEFSFGTVYDPFAELAEGVPESELVLRRTDGRPVGALTVRNSVVPDAVTRDLEDELMGPEITVRTPLLKLCALSMADSLQKESLKALDILDHGIPEDLDWSDWGEVGVHLDRMLDNLDDLESGNRALRSQMDDDLKEDPADFAVWKAAKPGEPAWDSPYGPGRPGWHIECSAMSRTHLGKTIDLHCGGQDLIFPHHENEIAQSECANGCTFARYWMHNGFINVDNQKMSKSLHNFFTVRDVANAYGYEPIRYFMLTAGYRMPLNYTVELIESCKNSLERLYTCRENLDFILGQGSFGAGETLKEKAAEARRKFCAAMDDDLNTPDALAALFDLVKEINTLSASASKSALETAAAVFDELAGVLGLLYNRKKDEVPADVQELVAQRAAAKKAKDWAAADALRAEIAAQGWAVKDTAQGPQLSRI